LSSTIYMYGEEQREREGGGRGLICKNLFLELRNGAGEWCVV